MDEDRDRSEEKKYLEKIKEIDMIWRINEQIMSFQSLEELLNSVLRGAAEVMEANSGSIMLIDPPGSDNLLVKAALRLRRNMVNKACCKVGEGIAGLVAERREGMLLLDDLMDPRLRTRRKVSDALSVPIIAEGNLIGVLNLNTKKDQAFSEIDLFLLNTLTKQIAMAIERGRRMEELRLRLKEMEADELEIVENLHRLTKELDEQRRQYQRLRQEQDSLRRDLEALSGPIA